MAHKWLDLNITESAVRNTFPARRFNVGRDLYSSGRVVSARIRGSRFHADMREQTPVSVSFELLRGEIMGGCSKYTCDNRCEHVVAALLYLARHTSSLLAAEKLADSDTRYLLTTIPAEKALAFLTDRLLGDEGMLGEFVKRFDLEDVHSPAYYREEMDIRYRDASRGGKVDGNIDLGGFFAMAQNATDAKKYGEAVKIFRTMSESIAERMDSVDDSDGYYLDCLVEAVEGMVEAVIRQKLPAEKKLEHMRYLLDAGAGSGGGPSQHYRDSLEALCTTEDDTECLSDLLAPMLEKDDCPADIVRMQVRTLEDLNRPDEARKAVKKFHKLDRDLFVKYMGMLESGDPEGERTAQDALDMFPDDPKVMEAALELCPPDSARRITLLKNLLAGTGDWKYLPMIKGTSSNWEFEVWSIANKFLAKSDTSGAVDVYLKGGKPDLAMSLMESLGDVELFKKYRARLAKAMPEKYFAAYGAAIRRFAASRTGRDHYERVRKHVLNAKSIQDGEGYRELVEGIRRSNRGKRSLIQIMDDV